MTPTNFFYWLQGYFEIQATAQQNRGPVVLSPEQAACVLRHIELVCAPTGDLPPRLGVVRVLCEMLREDPDYAGDLCHKLEREMHAQFEHVIDPGGDAQQEKLNAIHSPCPQYRPPRPAVVRC